MIVCMRSVILSLRIVLVMGGLGTVNGSLGLAA